MLDEDAGLLIITSQSRWRDANPDIIEFSQVLGCDMDIDEQRTEIYRETKDGERELQPAALRPDYDFNLTVHVNTPYFTEINLRVNDSTIDQRGSIEYREAKRRATEVRDALVQLRRGDARQRRGRQGPQDRGDLPLLRSHHHSRCQWALRILRRRHRRIASGSERTDHGLRERQLSMPACGGPFYFCQCRAKSSSATTAILVLKSKKSRPSIASAGTRQMPKPMQQPQRPILSPTTRCRNSPKNAGYICSSCGAELVSDGTVAVTTCPYCGNSAVAPGQLSGDFSPDTVIPFKLGRDDVTAALKEHYKGKILLPKSFVTGNHIDEVQGVYVPFWLLRRPR